VHETSPTPYVPSVFLVSRRVCAMRGRADQKWLNVRPPEAQFSGPSEPTQSCPACGRHVADNRHRHAGPAFAAALKLSKLLRGIGRQPLEVRRRPFRMVSMPQDSAVSTCRAAF